MPASFLLVWVLTGWEASANLAHTMPPDTLFRVVVGSVLIIAVAFLGLSAAIVGVLGVDDLGNAPVADLLAESVGPVAVVLGIGLALVLTFGNMNAYIASLASLGASIRRVRAVPGGPLTVPTLIALASLLLTMGHPRAEIVLVSVTAASQVPVLVLAAASGARLLPAGAGRRHAVAATAATTLLLVPAGVYLVAPLSIVAGVLAWEGAEAVRRGTRRGPRLGEDLAGDHLVAAQDCRC